MLKNKLPHQHEIKDAIKAMLLLDLMLDSEKNKAEDILIRMSGFNLSALQRWTFFCKLIKLMWALLHAHHISSNLRQLEIFSNSLVGVASITKQKGYIYTNKNSHFCMWKFAIETKVKYSSYLSCTFLKVVLLISLAWVRHNGTQSMYTRAIHKRWYQFHMYIKDAKIIVTVFIMATKA